MSAAAQPGLPFPPVRTRPEAFVQGAGNQEALERLAAWRAGLDRPARPLAVVVVITGPPGSGKSRLLEREAADLGASVRGPGADFDAEADIPGEVGAIAADDAHGFAPLDLFALIEASAQRGTPLMLAGDGRVADWSGTGKGKLPDLASRLSSIAQAPLGPPDEAMLASVLAGQLARRGLRAPFAAVAEAAGALRREYAAAMAVAEAAERLAARGYKKPAALLRDALAEASAHTL